MKKHAKPFKHPLSSVIVILFIYLLLSVFISLFCIQNYLKSLFVYAHRYS